MSNILRKTIFLSISRLNTEYAEYTEKERDKKILCILCFPCLNEKINYLLSFIFFFVFQLGFVFGAFPVVEREHLEGIVDDSPLARSEDKPVWDYLFGILRKHSEAEIDNALCTRVGFTELNRQPVEYRGQLVCITGRLVRCEWIPQHREPEPFDEELPEDEGLSAKKSNGFYESWILVRDKKDIPISVCSLAVPEHFPMGDGLNEQVLVTGFFYKRRLFLSSDDEELTTPTILAKTLRRIPSTTQKPKPVPVLQLIRNNTLIVFGVLLFLWFMYRIFKQYYRTK
ncbi:MAG: hypothetical protein LBI18_03700 [Planctomycetaceae bacterium]|jgi:hypothetical protein|nr:hypothetical protein [Planctomycetaceae bacterium]